MRYVYSTHVNMYVYIYIFTFRDRPLYSKSFYGGCTNKRNDRMASRLIAAVFLKISNLSIPICQGLCFGLDIEQKQQEPQIYSFFCFALHLYVSSLVSTSRFYLALWLENDVWIILGLNPVGFKTGRKDCMLLLSNWLRKILSPKSP